MGAAGSTVDNARGVLGLIKKSENRALLWYRVSVGGNNGKVEVSQGYSVQRRS